MSTNDEPETPVEEVSTDAVADLAAAKANAESTKPEVEETAQETNSETAEVKEEAQAESATTFTKEVPSIPGETPEEYYKNLALAYQNSTTEAMRLKGELDKKVDTPPPPIEAPVSTGDEVLTPEQLYIRQKQNEEITEAFSAITDKYPTLKDKDVYDKFVNEANLVGQVIVQSEKRYPSPKELYEKTAVILGLQPDNTEAIGSALKDTAASPRTASATPAPAAQSKVSEDVIALNLKMYPGKTRQEIIEELEPHIN